MLSVNNLDIRYGDKHLFKNVTVQVYEGNKLGLIGVNGAGKSTLLKIMAGITTTDDGVVSRSKNFTVAYLPQESEAIHSRKSLYEEAEGAFSHLLSLQEEEEALHRRLTEIDSGGKEFARILERLAGIQHQLENGDVYSIRARIEKILFGLGFKKEDLTMPASSFSGGWVMRLMLAKILLAEPTLLLLDEPTNHLDLPSLTWLEEFLLQYKGAMALISHDRAFLDRVTNWTMELSLGKITLYKGNYSWYLKEREERKAIEKAAYENQQAKIRQTMRFVERFRAKSTKAKQVQSRVKQLEKMELLELSEEEHHIGFSFPPAPDCGRDVLSVEGVSKSYDGKVVFQDVSFMLQRGDKVAVVGVNGAGKSTLLKLIGGMIEKNEGDIRLGTNVKLSYFGQHQAQELSPALTVLDSLSSTAENMTVTRMRSLLGAFLFRGEDVDKKVEVLSGGEKSRLALARMIATPANCMLLDEPTNHLDMTSQEVLQEAMGQYDGTIIVVSHNRAFVDHFVNRVLEVRDNRVTLYEGNVEEYLQLQRRLEDEKTGRVHKEKKHIDVPAEKKISRKEKRKQEALQRQSLGRKIGPYKKQVQEAEKNVEKLERQKDELEALMADPELYKDEQKWVETSKEYDTCKRRLDRWYDKWETAQDKIDRIEAEYC